MHLATSLQTIVNLMFSMVAMKIALGQIVLYIIIYKELPRTAFSVHFWWAIDQSVLSLWPQKSPYMTPWPPEETSVTTTSTPIILELSAPSPVCSTFYESYMLRFECICTDSHDPDTIKYMQVLKLNLFLAEFQTFQRKRKLPPNTCIFVNLYCYFILLEHSVNGQSPPLHDGQNIPVTASPIQLAILLCWWHYRSASCITNFQCSIIEQDMKSSFE